MCVCVCVCVCDVKRGLSRIKVRCVKIYNDGVCVQVFIPSSLCVFVYLCLCGMSARIVLCQCFPLLIILLRTAYSVRDVKGQGE